MALIIVLASSFAIGMAIGAVGIGGVLLVPVLTLIGGLPIGKAIALAMWCFLFTGAAGAVTYGRRGHIDWRSVFWMSIAAAPGAFLGSLLVRSLAERWLLGLLALVQVAAAGSLLCRNWRSRDVHAGGELTPHEAIGIGALSGIGSSATGTSGPLIVLPLSLWRGAPLRGAIGLSQASQLPIALAATAGHLAGEGLDFALGAALAAATGAGVVLGARTAHLLPASQLRGLVALAMAIAAASIFGRLVGWI